MARIALNEVLEVHLVNINMVLKTNSSQVEIARIVLKNAQGVVIARMEMKLVMKSMHHGTLIQLHTMEIPAVEVARIVLNEVLVEAVTVAIA